MHPWLQVEAEALHRQVSDTQAALAEERASKAAAPSQCAPPAATAGPCPPEATTSSSGLGKTSAGEAPKPKMGEAPSADHKPPGKQSRNARAMAKVRLTIELASANVHF